MQKTCDEQSSFMNSTEGFWLSPHPSKLLSSALLHHALELQLQQVHERFGGGNTCAGTQRIEMNGFVGEGVVQGLLGGIEIGHRLRLC